MHICRRRKENKAHASSSVLFVATPVARAKQKMAGAGAGGMQGTLQKPLFAQLWSRSIPLGSAPRQPAGSAPGSVQHPPQIPDCGLRRLLPQQSSKSIRSPTGKQLLPRQHPARFRDGRVRGRGEEWKNTS